jgi:hypothetical protein
VEKIQVKIFQIIFKAGHIAISILFVLGALALIVFALLEMWQGINPNGGEELNTRFNLVLQSIASLTIAVAALELSQTILEEEVLREAHMSAPTRVRRFLSRFLIVVVVSLSIESLVAVFRFIHEDPSQLPNAASIAAGGALLLIGWGVFIRLNRSAEELEPEAMQDAKREDEKLE